MRKSIEFSQNFLVNKNSLAQIMDNSSIKKRDVVYEIGAGTGAITEELLSRCQKVTAFEIDENLFKHTLEKLKGYENLEMLNEDFMKFPLPKFSYKVFSNIPFRLTSDVIKKLTFSDNPPIDAYLIVQKEAALRFLGKPYDRKNTQVAMLIKPWFNLSIGHKFENTDFSPKPSVETVLLRIRKRGQPEVEDENKKIYQDFVVFTFNQFKPSVYEGLGSIFGSRIERLSFARSKKPSELDYEEWVILFREFLDLPEGKKVEVIGSYTKLLEQQGRVEKINRTRKDREWRKKKRAPFVPHHKGSMLGRTSKEGFK